jgi:diguanylate cyclase (GGDEF)-like protein
MADLPIPQSVHPQGADQADRRGPVVLVFDHVNAYQTTLVGGIRSVLEPAGLPVVVYANDPFARSVRPPLRRLLTSPDLRGCIATILTDPDCHADTLAVATQTGMPFVHIGAPVPGHPSIAADNKAGMRDLMAHLLDECGARTIALVRGLRHHPDAAEREAVVLEELAARGLTLPPHLMIEGGFDRDETYAAMSRLLGEYAAPDAVVALNDRSAVGALDALTDHGLAVPDDVLLTGFDDDAVAQQATPGLTTVNQELYAQGVLAAELLLAQIGGEQQQGHRTQRSSLVVRGSTGQPTQTSVPVPDVPKAFAAMERGLSVNRAFMACRTVPELLAEVANSLPRLGLRRCVIVLNQQSADLGTVVLRHLEGYTDVRPDRPPFRLDDVLPLGLRDQLGQGSWSLQPLCVDSDDLGYVLFDQYVPDQYVGELLRMDLGRAVDSLLRARRHASALERHAAELESLVEQRTAELQVANRELTMLTRMDPMTGVANRAAFDAYLEEQWQEHLVRSHPLSLLLVDIDHFKEHNDQFGHLSGDACLREVGRCLKEALWSPYDLAARYGGDEFVGVLPRTDAAGAAAVAHRVQETLRRLTGSATSPTVSIGVATVDPANHAAATDLVALADAALYDAKTNGRNRVVTSIVA